MPKLSELFFGGPKRVQFINPLAPTQILEVDVTFRQSLKLGAMVTSHPVEAVAGGLGEISDHSARLPTKFSVEGKFTDTPITYVQALQSLVTGGGSRSLEAFGFLASLHGLGQPFVIVAGLAVIDNMLFEDLEFSQSTNTGQAVDFTANLKRVTFAESALSGLTGIKAKAVPAKAKPTQNLGKLVTSNSDDLASRQAPTFNAVAQ